MTSKFSDALSGAMPAVYAFGGLLFGGWITRSNQHRQWTWNNKAREYRELMDALHDCITTVIVARPNLSTWDHPAVNNAMMQASRVFANRIFIHKILKQKGLIEDWYGIKRFVFSEPGEPLPDESKLVYGITSLGVREQELQDKIIKVALEDLRLK